MFRITETVTEDLIQMTRVQYKDTSIISIYRSSGDKSLAAKLRVLLVDIGCCMVVGDLNICTSKHPNHEVFSTLRSAGFKVLVTEATHYGGGHLDQIWYKSTSQNYNIQLYSPYYTCRDHDALLFTKYDQGK